MDAGDFVCGKGGVGLLDAVRHVDGAGGIFNDDGFKAESLAVDGGIADAEVIGETAEEEAGEAPLSEVAGKTGRGEMVVFEKGGVAVDMAAEPFAEDQFGMGDSQHWVKGCAFAVLDDVFGPEGLRAVGGLDRFEGLLVAVSCRKGDVLRRMPVLGEDDVIKFFGDDVDERDDGVAVCDAQGAIGHEVVLDVDDEEGIGGL